MPKKHTYKIEKIKAKDFQGEFDLEDFAFAVDTAGSWEGTFPKIGKGDYIVTIGSADSEAEPVLVSRRYTGATGAKDAVELALSAYAERKGYKTDDNGDLIEQQTDAGFGIPCWVEQVHVVT